MRTTRVTFYILICLFAVVATSCAPGSVSLPAPTMTSTMLPTLLPTKTVKPIDTATPTASATEVPQPCSVNPLQAVYVNDLIFTEPADRDGWCEVKLPLISYKTIGYALVYPENWIVTLAGVEGMNLLFDTARDQRVFIQLTTTDLSLERADEATYGFEMVEPEPLVAPDEEQISRTIQTIGDKQVLVLLTRKDDTPIKRHFLLHSGTLYMFEVKLPTVELDTGETIELITDVEEMITSLQFMR